MAVDHPPSPFPSKKGKEKYENGGTPQLAPGGNLGSLHLPGVFMQGWRWGYPASHGKLRGYAPLDTQSDAKINAASLETAGIPRGWGLLVPRQ